MSLQPFPPSPATMVRLPPQCSTAAAVSLHPELVAAATGDAPVVIDGSAVETVGQAMLQLLLATKTARSDVRVNSPSQALRDRIRLCALDSIIGLDDEEI